MDEALRLWPVISTVFTGLLAWAIWSIKRGLVSKEELSALRKDAETDVADLRKDVEAEFSTLNDRTTRMETRLEAIPDRKTIDDLCRRVDEVHGDVRELTGSMDQVATQLRLLLQHHLEK
ncbi:MAG: DUF2730 family protein [Magnetococcales bacterium]|nr:DUF2730 family protein [Magnetococcales bacterium]